MTPMRKGSALRRAASVIALTAATGLVLAACSSGGPAAGGGNPDDLEAALEAGGEITYWSWTPSAEAQAEAFMAKYPEVTVNVVNAGTNTEEYTKLQNALKAGSGAPDVVQIEYYAFPQFALTEGLLDLAPYGFADLEDDYTASTWNSVDFDGKVYGLPQDSGPMALFYNKTVFDQYGIAVPTTWDEYIEAARQLTAADPSKKITNDTGDAGFATSMIWQAGGQPFTAEGTDVTIDLADEGSKKWADTWNTLVEEDLLASTSSWSDEWFTGLGDGSIATLIIGAWMPGNLVSSVPDAAGDWRVAPMPTYDGTPVSAENGGGGQAVTSQSKNPALAAAFLKWLNNDEESLTIFAESGGFPSTNAQLESDEFLGQEAEYFGGQKINEVLVQAAKDVRPGWQYLPFQVYANSIFGDTVGQSYASKSDLNEGLATWQEQLVQYGNDQGFTVNQ
ncbi:multiple sugar transport system substrate-binding protein [Microbacterium imperiale]|uniref:Sugar ABC transporter substrate-binding protein n=2 Tax=Microbacterium imperiale TaxID=33884 RepID=A0A9W6HJ41_9MICO|nr:sugar ABC transporter substrate-binding protein [Microbacterium imperiale]MBP2421462.1 multiple sugar transport system substrate-binding protein [Microbacterium imperiale]BFE41801.1 sugar ABC transporter substrate-binding protein [Microbacterium imperiale]GLJ80753.1 sugar ABC transporter substrate-binding protein [Microbacterium imperiale]